MTLDELVQQIGTRSADPLARQLVSEIRNWERNSEPDEVLRRRVEKFFGSVWFEPESLHIELYTIWTAFCRAREAGRGK